MLASLHNSNWAQLVECQQFSGSTLLISVVLTWSWLPNAFYLWITFGLASSFTLDFVVGCLVNPRVYSDTCFHQRYSRTIILQSLDFKSCIHCDSNTSHCYHSVMANHKNLLIQWHDPSSYSSFLFPCIEWEWIEKVGCEGFCSVNPHYGQK